MLRLWIPTEDWFEEFGIDFINSKASYEEFPVGETVDNYKIKVEPLEFAVRTSFDDLKYVDLSKFLTRLEKAFIADRVGTSATFRFYREWLFNGTLKDYNISERFHRRFIDWNEFDNELKKKTLACKERIVFIRRINWELCIDFDTWKDDFTYYRKKTEEELKNNVSIYGRFGVGIVPKLEGKE